MIEQKKLEPIEAHSEVVIPPRRLRYEHVGRKMKHPEWMDMKVSKDGTKGDVLLYEDTPKNYRELYNTRTNYNRRKDGMRFTVQRIVDKGRPLIAVQRIV